MCSMGQNRLYAHVTILKQLPDTRSRVGLSDLGSLLGVEPDWNQHLPPCNMRPFPSSSPPFHPSVPPSHPSMPPARRRPLRSTQNPSISPSPILVVEARFFSPLGRLLTLPLSDAGDAGSEPLLLRKIDHGER